VGAVEFSLAYILLKDQRLYRFLLVEVGLVVQLEVVDIEPMVQQDHSQVLINLQFQQQVVITLHLDH
jgi:hypothetical protein